MSKIQERGSTHVYHVSKISKEEIERMVERCVYEQPPFCNAACPLKLDTRALLKAAADGNFKKALQLYEKIAPFPLVLSQGCEAPCEGTCRLGECGEGVAVRAIETAVARYGEESRRGSVFRSAKKQKAAVFGSGLFALFLAGELEKKMYPVTVFCAEADEESFLRSAAPFLDEEAFALELKRLKRKEIRFEFERELTKAFFDERRGDYQILCASEAAAKAFFPEAVCTTDVMLYEQENLIMGSGSGVMDAAFGAKKAALTADRLAQKLDPRNTRGSEGAVESTLYTDLSAATALKRVPGAGDGYTREQAIEEAQRCLQCRCEECLKTCAFLRHYGKHPGLLAREIYNNTQIIMGDHQLNKPMNSCALCGQCTAVCPNGMDMARVCHLARQNMVSTDKMPLSPHEFALLDMLFSNEEAFLARPQPGFETCRYVFFPGCQAAAVAPETVRAAWEDLSARLPGGVGIMLGCCGAIADWAGRTEIYEQTKAFLDSELSKLGDPIVIAGCPTCLKQLRGHDGVSVVGVWDILTQIGLPEGAKGLDRPAAVHDACGARGDQETQSAIRTLLTQLGCTLREPEDSGDRAPCCGYGGLAGYANPEVAGELTEQCLSRGEGPWVTYCMACRDRFAKAGQESHHLLELVYGTDAGDPPDISEKRYHRRALKRELLREYWNEETVGMAPEFKITYTPEAREMMDARMILTEDVEAVLRAMRETLEAVLDSESGLTITRARIGNTTFWVGFTSEGEDSYLVHRAYSHRMQVERRNG